MQSHKLGELIGLNVFVVLLLLAGGCQTLGLNDVEVVVPPNELRGDWTLSPTGDKIAYRSEGHTVLLFPSTKQKHDIDCPVFWLDNTTLSCGRGRKISILTTNDFVEIPLKKIKASEINLEELLQESGKIYRLEWIPDVIYVLNADYKYNLDKNYQVTNIENIDAVLQGYAYVTVPYLSSSSKYDEKIYSPTGQYYYRENLVRKANSFNDVLTIYDAESDEKLAEFIAEAGLLITVGGWAADSSGVYFQTKRKALGVLGGHQHGITKLKVP